MRAADFAFALADDGIPVRHQGTEVTALLRTERVYEPDQQGLMVQVDRPSLLVEPGTLAQVAVDDLLVLTDPETDAERTYRVVLTPKPVFDGVAERIALSLP